MSVEFWTTGVGIPHAAVRRAQRAEADGYDGMTVVDSQNLSGDPYVALALAAQVTTKLRLGTGVTNPVTRHAAATASAIATVQGESRGRAVLGIGRGDSALAHLGLSPAPLAVFERYLHDLRAYLAGEEVPFGDGQRSTVSGSRTSRHPAASSGCDPAIPASRSMWRQRAPGSSRLRHAKPTRSRLQSVLTSHGCAGQ